MKIDSGIGCVTLIVEQILRIEKEATMYRDLVRRTGHPVLLLAVILAVAVVSFGMYVVMERDEEQPELTQEGQTYTAAASRPADVYSAMLVSETEVSENVEAQIEAQGRTYSISEIQRMFPEGRYFNGGSMGTTSTPCNHERNGLSFCNCYAGFAYQCIGGALYWAELYQGSSPMNWQLSNSVDSIVTGSVIRYNVNSYYDHSIFITGVSADGSTFTYSDVNADNHCGIRHNRTISRSSLSSLLGRRLLSSWSYGAQQSTRGFVLVPTQVRNIGECDISVTGPELIKDESSPKVTVRSNGNVLTYNDYYFEYFEDSEDGGYVNVYGRGRYTGSRTLRYNLIYGQLSECTAVDFVNYYDYDGWGPLPAVKLVNKYGNEVSSYDYHIEYEDDTVSPGKHFVTVRPSSNTHKYRGELKLEYSIGRINIEDEKAQFCSIYIADAELTEKYAIPEVSINNRYTGYDLVEGVDYTIEYSGNNRRGRAAAVITGIGDYVGQVTEHFNVTVNDSEITIH